MAKRTSNIFTRRILRSGGYSLQGLRVTLKKEEAFRVEVALALFLVPLAFYLGDNGMERALLAGSILLVLIVEVINSAIENVVDRFGGEEHELSGQAKDQGSAAVFLSLVMVLLVWGTVLLFP